MFFTNRRYAGISTDAKILYAILLDRMSLSAANGWYDEDGRLYIYYTVSQASELLGFGREKIIRLFRELEKADLIERRRQGLGKASVIYQKEPLFCDVCKSDFRKSANQNFGSTEKRSHEVCKSVGSYTEYNQNNNSYTESSIIEIDADEIEEQVKFSMEYDVLEERIDKDILNEIVCIMTELMCSISPTIRVGRQEQPRTLVQSRIMSIRCEHIEYVVDCMKKNSARIKDIKSYLIAALFNAPSTFFHYCQAEVNADFA